MICCFCSFPETVIALWYENQGYYEQAKATYEGVVSRARAMHNYAPAPPNVISEYKLWEQHWMKCAHELGQWDVLTDFGKSLGGTNPFPGIMIDVFICTSILPIRSILVSRTPTHITTHKLQCNLFQCIWD